MEKTYMNAGVANEEVAEIMTDVVREIASRIDLKDVARCVKEKHPAVTEEQWDLIMYDNQDIPDIRDMDVLNGFLEEFNFKQAIQAAIELGTESDQDKESEKLEE